MKYFTHGHSGHIQDQSAISPAPTNYYGFGLDFGLSKLETWVHFAIPSVGDGTHGVQYIQLDFKAEGGSISDIHVYDGEVRFKELQGKWTGPAILDLGQVWKIYRGLGVSVLCKRNIDGSNLFRFLDIGAEFVEL